MATDRPALRLARNTIWSAVTSLSAAALSFFLVPFILGRLGETQYGVWVLIGSIFSYTTLLQVGMASATNREVPLQLVRGDVAGLREVTSTATAFFGVGGALCLALTVVLHFKFAGWMNIPAHLVTPTGQAILIVGVPLSIGIMIQTFGAVLSGYQRYDVLALGRLVPLVVRALAILIALRYTESLLAVAVIFSVTELATHVVNTIVAHRLLPPKSLTIGAVNFSVLQRMLAYGLNTFLYTIGFVILAKASELVIGASLSPEKVTLYSLASALVSVSIGMIDSFCGAIKPMVTELHARNEHGRVKEIALRTQKYILLLALPGCLGLQIMGTPFLQVWVHRRTSELSLVLSLLAIAQFLRVIQFSNFLVLVGMGDHRIFGKIMMATGVTAIVLVLLAVWAGWGIVGVAAANLVSIGVFSGIVVPLYCGRRLGVELKEWLARVLTPCLLASVPVTVVLLAWRFFLPPTTWSGMVLAGVTCGIAMALGIWRFGDVQAEVRMVTGRMAPRAGTAA